MPSPDPASARDMGQRARQPGLIVRAGLVALALVAGAAAGCSRPRSIYLEPGHRDPPSHSGQPPSEPGYRPQTP
jgi:hypothetical protein